MMRAKGGVSLATAVLAAVCAGCDRRAPVAVRDSSGRSVEAAGPARRIVSTVPSNTEILYALGLADRVVGVTAYCSKTCDTEGKAVVGGWTTPDMGKIRALEPDLIFAFGGLQKGHLEGFREIAPTYFFEPLTVEDTLECVLAIGALTGSADRAAEIVARQREALAGVRSALAALPAGERPRVARVFGTDAPVLTMGRQSFLSDVIELAGGVNAFADVDDGYFEVPFERLAEVDPDVLLVNGEDPAKVRAAFAASPRFSGLRAVREGRVLVYSCDHICHPNATVCETVAMVARGLHPRLFPGKGAASR